MKNKNRDSISEHDRQLAIEAQEWDSGKRHPRDWEDVLPTTPHIPSSTLISLRVPATMLLILKEFARREGIGYQVLMKRWLDDRIKEERDKLAAELKTRPVR